MNKGLFASFDKLALRKNILISIRSSIAHTERLVSWEKASPEAVGGEHVLLRKGQ
jgi:hypothetical protein